MIMERNRLFVRILLYVSLFFMLHASFFISVQAQITHSDQGREDKAATEVLKKASSRFNDNVSFSVNMVILDGQNKETLRQSAQVLYNKGKYHMTVADQEIISDGATVWQWNKTAKEVGVTNVSNDDIDLMNPALLLANHDKNFRAKFIRTEDDGTAVVDLQPRFAASYHKIRLLVNGKTGVLNRMEVHKYDSGRELYDIKGFKRVGTAASQFTFDPAKHPGVEVIDMR